MAGNVRRLGQRCSVVRSSCDGNFPPMHFLKGFFVNKAFFMLLFVAQMACFGVILFKNLTKR